MVGRNTPIPVSAQGEEGFLGTKPTEYDELRQRLSSDRFRDWYNERQYRHNIENGTPYFNESGYVPDERRHSPSQLLQCHRKIAYRQHNSPAEQADPEGIFWFGTRFEEDVVFPFLERAVTGPDTYVCNTVWVDFTVPTGVGELRIKGATDPVIVDRDAVPVLPTEIKTKSSIGHLKSPNRHHKAQLHAYMVGLSEKYDIELTEGVLMYGCRNSLNSRFFHVDFDQSFWEDTVLEWATNHTQYRINDELPPAEPEYDWECGVCSYRERCGMGQCGYQDVGFPGLLPHFSDYPRDKLVDYLQAYPEEKLTPVLAAEYPDLATEYGVYQWYCPECSATFDWEAVTQISTGYQNPVCPTCAEKGSLTELQNPEPSEHPSERVGGEDSTGEGA